MEVSESSKDLKGDLLTCLLGLIVGVVVLIYFFPGFQKIEADRVAVQECEKSGGKPEYEDFYGRENIVCMKEYTSCGPDENKPGFTVCEQKFKRIN